MTANIRNASLFVHTLIDWMHTDASICDPCDDSVNVFGRENFVMKVGYTAGGIESGSAATPRSMRTWRVDAK